MCFRSLSVFHSVTVCLVSLFAITSLLHADTLTTKTGQTYDGTIAQKTELGVLFDAIDAKGKKMRRSFPWTQISSLREGGETPPVAPATPRSPTKPAATSTRPVTGSAATIFAPFAQKYCTECHGAEQQKGKLRLDNLAFTPTDLKNYEQWQEILARMELGEMPPEDHKLRPAADELTAITEWLTPSLKTAKVQAQRGSGKTVLRRLNRVQYRNTLRDLLGIDVDGKNDPTENFPPDEIEEGFSNLGSALLMSDLLMENYLRAAEISLDRAKIGTSKDAEALRNFASLAYRRPTSAATIAPYLQQLGDGKTDTKRTYQAILCSPQMVYFSEQPGKLDHYSVASRLSYFLWNSMPDKALLELAAQEKLHDPSILTQQIDRMLKDSKSKSFVDTFIWEWLRLQNMVDMPPEEKRFPDYYKNELRIAFVTETTLFFRYVLDENRPVTDFLDSDYTFANSTLAKHYDISGVSGSAFQKVSLEGHPTRGGLLGQASVLSTTTDGMTTTPIYRGKWVHEVLLGQKLPPPPADVPDLPEVKGAKTIREQLDMHRKVRECAVCHVKIDPLGFPLESFDPIGAYRKKYDNGRDVETDGRTTTGSYKDVTDFKKLLLRDKDKFTFALTRQLLTYATGRKMEASDRSDINKIVKELSAKGYGFKDLFHLIGTSEMFLNN